MKGDGGSCLNQITNGLLFVYLILLWSLDGVGGQVIAEAVRTTLGPRGMDKLMVDSRGKQRKRARTN